jgi:conjugal transfer ATP-binding protein TraC
MSMLKNLLAKGNRVSSLLEDLPHWDIAQGVVFTRDAKQNLVMEVGLELHPTSPLFASPELLSNVWHEMKAVLQLGVPLRERGRMILEATPTTNTTLKQYISSHSSEIPLIQALGQSTFDLYERERLEGKVLAWRSFFTCTIAMPEKRKAGIVLSPAELIEALEKALQRRGRLFNLLKTSGFNPVEMDTQEAFSLMFRYFNPTHTPNPAPQFLGHDHRRGFLPVDELRQNKTVHSKTLREQLACSVVDNLDPNTLLVGDRYVSAIAFREVPASTEPNCIRFLVQALSANEAALSGRQMYLVEDFVHQPYGPKMRSIQQLFERLNASAEGNGNRGNPQAAAHAKQLDHAIGEVSETGDHFYTTAITTILMGRSRAELEAVKESTISAFARYPGSEPVYGAYQTRFQYFACAPFGAGIGEYTFEPVESDAVNLMPVSLPWKGLENPVMLVRTRAGTLATIDPFSNLTNNWNGAVLAGSGAGKTFLMQKIMAALVRHKARVTIVDRKEDYQSFLNAITQSAEDTSLVATVEFDPESGVRYNMFELLEGQEMPDESKKASVKAQLRCIIEPAGDAVEAAIESAIIDECIARAYRQRGKNTVLTDFYKVTQTINAVGGREMSIKEIELARSLGIRMGSFVGDRSTYGRFLDGPSNINVDADIAYFKTGKLESYPELKTLSNLMISDITWKMARSNIDVLKLSILEEFWSMLRTPEAKAMAEEFYRLARSYKLAMYAISQDPADLEQVPGLVASSCYFWIGRQENDDLAERVGRLLELPQSAKDDLKKLKREPGKYNQWMHFVRTGEEKSGDVLNIDVTPLEIALFSSHPNDKAKRLRYIEKYGSVLRAAQKMAEEAA